MPLTAADKRKAVTMAVKLTEAAVSNSGGPALMHPEHVTKLIASVAAKIRELLEQAESET